MTQSFHLVVWIDQQAARLYAFANGGVHKSLVHRSLSRDTGNIHHKAGSVGSGHADIDEAFLKLVTDAIAEAQEILIVGPAQAKFALKTFIERHKPDVEARILGVEPMGQARDSEIYEFARRFFKHADQVMPPH